MDEKPAQKWTEQVGGLLLKYRYILLAAIAGLVLLYWPQSQQTKGQADAATVSDVSFSLVELEQKLEQTLSRIEGAGRVSVVLSVSGEVEQVLARNTERTDQQLSSEVVLVGRGSGSEEAVVVTRKYPEFRGALIVCEGGDDPQVKLKLTQAVSALTGLGAAKISVCKGNDPH